MSSVSPPATPHFHLLHGYFSRQVQAVQEAFQSISAIDRKLYSEIN